MTVEEILEVLVDLPKQYEVRVRTGPRVTAAPVGVSVTCGAASITAAEVQCGPRQVLHTPDPCLSRADARAPARGGDPGFC